MLEAFKTAKKAVGVKQVGRALRSGQATFVCLAQDADPKVTEPIALLCEKQSIPMEWVTTMAELGKACGIAVGSAVAALVE
jgi:large subunit ribosomal protein L7A